MRARGTACGTGSTSSWTAPTSGPRRSCTCTSSICCRRSRPHTPHLDVGVPARGWHGEAYRGHIFWDELFIFPFLNFERPDPGRRAAGVPVRAPRRGPGGGPGGRVRRCDVPVAERLQRAGGDPGGAPQPEVGAVAARPLAPAAARQHRDRLQRLAALHGHRRALAFLRFTGAELLIEIARFWASIATYNPALDRYEIHGVMGPTSTTRPTRTPTSPGCATTPTPT